MYSPNYYRHQSSPYKAPSRSANTYDVSSNRSRSNLNETCDETWPLDEVINKLDIKSDSEDDLPLYNTHNQHSWNSYSSNRQPSERVYSAFGGDSSKSFDNGTRVQTDYGGKLDSGNYKWPKYTYDRNNNYLTDPVSNWNLDEDSPMLRDVGIQCNLKKYKPLVLTKSSVAEPMVIQKPPIKVIKSTSNGFVSAYSDVPKLSSPKKQTQTSYSVLNSSSDTNSPIYSQIDKSGKLRSNQLNNGNNSNLNIVYKQPLNESLNSYNFANGKQYDVKSKEISFNVSNSNAPRIHLPSSNYLEPDRGRSFGSCRDINELPLEKETIEETISISNASTDSKDSYRHVANRQIHHKYPDEMSFTGHSITSKASSNYRRDSPARLPYDRYSLTKQSPYGTLEKKNREVNSKNKKSKKSSHKQDENMLLANNSLRLKSSKHPHSERLYKSNADIREQFLRDETRGGLAAAYKNRQQNNNNNRHRALSLNRMNTTGGTEEQSGPLTIRHPSQSHLHGGSSSRLSDNGSYHRGSRNQMQHERDPIVMYIPTVSHQRISHEEPPPKPSSILRNNSTKSTTTLPSKGKKAAKEAKSQSKINIKEAAAASNKAKSEEKKKADLNRRHSMPKDTKINWFSKLKLRSK